MKYYIICTVILILNFSCEKKKEISNIEVIEISKLEKLNKQIESSPSVGLFNQRAEYYLQNNENELAFEDLKTALNLDSNNAKTYYIGAKIFKNTIQIPLSLEYAKKAERLGLNDLGLFLLMAEENLILMQYQDAIMYCNKGLKIDNSSAKAYYLKGLVYEESKDLKRAISSYQTALEQDNSYSDAYCNLIKLHTAMKDYDLADQYVESAIRFVPNDKFVWYNYGILLEHQNLIDSAIVIFKETVKLDSTFDFPYYKLGLNYTQKKEFQKAESTFIKLLDVNPTFEPAYRDFGNMYILSNQKVKAKEILRKGLIQFPENEKIIELYNSVK